MVVGEVKYKVIQSKYFVLCNRFPFLVCWVTVSAMRSAGFQGTSLSV